MFCIGKQPGQLVDLSSKQVSAQSWRERLVSYLTPTETDEESLFRLCLIVWWDLPIEKVQELQQSLGFRNYGLRLCTELCTIPKKCS